MSTSTYPVRVDATLDSHLSRWLWLVKWFLAIPHYFVLAFLWVAFFVLSVVALVAIVFTGRYPRGIFDFNVGVLRWSWRVAYYAYGGLGTDHYPPFSLEDRPDYPAHLEIAYPEHLSRGLVLVKWWLLAIPHYLVLALFLGTGVYVATSGDDTAQGWSGGLIGLLVFIAAVVLLFTGRYPRSIFDLVLGLNRWALRVAAYAGLMTDEYPPFRLDMGGTDPGTTLLAIGATEAPPAQTADVPTTPAATPPAAPHTPPPTGGTTHWGAGRILAVIFASVFALTSLGLLTGGLILRLSDSALRDNQGYLMSSSAAFDSPGYAITSENIELSNGGTQFDLPQRWLGTVRVEADAVTGDSVFVGVAPTKDVEAYLAGVAHSMVVDPVGDNGDPTSRFIDGDAPGQNPADETFWVTSAEGPGQQTISWDPEQGDWTLVVMNGDASSPVATDVAVGAELPVLDDVALALLISGTLLFLVSVAVIVVAVRRPRPIDRPTSTPPTA